MEENVDFFDRLDGLQAGSARSFFSDEQWEAILKTRERGVSTKEIFAVLPLHSYKTLNAFTNSLRLAKARYEKRKRLHVSSRDPKSN